MIFCCNQNYQIVEDHDYFPMVFNTIKELSRESEDECQPTIYLCVPLSLALSSLIFLYSLLWLFHYYIIALLHYCIVYMLFRLDLSYSDLLCNIRSPMHHIY